MDYMDHEDSWSRDDLFRCYQRYQVDYGKEFCDSKFETGVELMRCYQSKEVPRGEEFCLSNTETDQELVTCYESIPIFNQNYCDLKYLEKEPKLKCYREKAKLVLDREFCISQFENIDEIYECYIEIGLMEFKNREYCEIYHPEDTQAKYDCIDQVNFDSVNDMCLN